MRSLLARSIVPTLALALLSGLHSAAASTPRTLVDRDARGRPLSATHVPLDEATVPMPGIRSRVFTYDDRDNPLGVAETFDVGPQRDYAYTYHPSGELASAVEDGVTALYGRTTAPAPGAPDEHLVETVTLDQVATTRAYDRLGRLVDVQRGGESWQLAWQPTGMLHSITGGGLVETRTYQPSALQRLATLTVADAGGGATHYDASYVWRLGSVDDPLPEGDPAQPAATLSVTTGDGVTDYWFDQQWRLEQVVYPEADGERRLHHYTLAGDGTRLMETVWRTWDDAGNPAIEQVERFRHEYDAAGRLDAVRRDVWAADTWVEDSPGLDADDNPLPRLDVAFDPLGRMRTWVEDGQTRTFTWDAESRMVEATLGAGAPGGGETWNYAYNWRDQRTLREGGALGAEWAYAYRWGADGLLTEQVTAPSGAVTDRAFVQGAGLTLGVVSGAGVTAFGHDHLGSPVVTRAPGGAVEPRRFGAWGALASGDAPAHGEVQVGYTGHGFDPESGLVYAQARYYATGLGVFLSEDPYEGSLGEPLSLGRWGYVHGNPVELVDPDGRIGTPAQRAEEWDREDTPKSEVFLGFLRSSCDGNLHCAEHLWRLNREVNLSHSEAADQGSQFLQRNRAACRAACEAQPGRECEDDDHCTVLMNAYRRVPGQMEAGVVGAVVAGANIDREVQTIKIARFLATMQNATAGVLGAGGAAMGDTPEEAERLSALGTALGDALMGGFAFGAAVKNALTPKDRTVTHTVFRDAKVVPAASGQKPLAGGATAARPAPEGGGSGRLFPNLTQAELSMAVDAPGSSNLMLRAPAPTGSRYNVNPNMMANEHSVPLTSSAVGSSQLVQTKVRVHTADPTAPPGSNSATGNTVTMTQQGGRRIRMPDGTWRRKKDLTDAELNQAHIPIHR